MNWPHILVCVEERKCEENCCSLVTCRLIKTALKAEHNTNMGPKETKNKGKEEKGRFLEKIMIGSMMVEVESKISGK